MIRRPLALLVAALALGACATIDAPVEDRSREELVAPPRPTAQPEHVVERGDTLYGIAFRHGLDVGQLAHWNGLRAPFTIYPGQRLRLSARDATRVESGGHDEPYASTQPLREPEPPRPVAATPAPRTPAPRPLPVAPSTPEPLPDAPPAPLPRAEAAPVATTPAPPVPVPAPPPTARVESAIAPAVVVPGTQRVSGGVGWRWPAQGSLLNRFAAGDPGRQGIDIRGRPGQAVLAAADGEVVYSGNGLIGYGELIIIEHPNGFLSAYGHNRKRLVAEGGRVLAGQPIAEMGRSGSGIDLLHFEIRRRGKPVDPLLHLPGR